MSNRTEEERSADAASAKRRSDIYEVIATVLLGVATVAIAWSANQSNVWGGSQDKLLAESVRVSNESVDALQVGDSTLQLDQILFVELLIQVDEQDGEISELSEQILDNMSEEGRAVTEQWIDGAIDQPFEDEEYQATLYTDGEELQAESDEMYADAVQANTNGDRYVLASTLMATVLFFAGISMVLNSERVRRILLAVASIALSASVIYMLTLPVTS